MEFKIKPYEELTLTDDFVFCKVMQNEEVCKETIETLLHVRIKRIVYVEPQKTIDMNYNSKGIRLDVYVEDDKRVFDVEIQTTLKNELPKRSRYYQSIIDINSLRKGKLYTELKESYVVFICTGDPFKFNLPCYTFENICREKEDLLLDDKSYKVFYNIKAYKEAGDIKTSALLEYLQNGKSSNKLTEKLNELVYEAKKNQKWRKEYMTLEMMKTEKLYEGIKRGIALGREEGREEGREAGARNKALETATNALMLGISADKIATITGLSLEEIEKLKK